MKRFLYVVAFSMLIVLSATASIKAQQAPLRTAPEVPEGYPPACVDYHPGSAESIQARAQKALTQRSSESREANALDKDGDGTACEYVGSEKDELRFEDGSVIFAYSVDRRVGQYVRGRNASFGPHRRDENNYVVEYSGTAGKSHYDRVVGQAIGRPNTPWGYNYFIVYDYREANRLGFTSAGFSQLYAHERAHTRGWGHYEGNRSNNQAYCPGTGPRGVPLC